MKGLLTLLLQILTTIPKLLGPKGTKAIVADSLLMIQQLLVIKRSRRIVGFGAHAGDVDGIALCHIFNTANFTQGAPHYLSSDNDPLFRYHRWQANLRILKVQEIKTFPYGPLSHPFIERLIGTLRREFLDPMSFWNANDLERKLKGFRGFYNAHGIHTSLSGDTPSETTGETISRRAGLNQFQWKSHCRGLYQLPLAA